MGRTGGGERLSYFSCEKFMEPGFSSRGKLKDDRHWGRTSFRRWSAGWDKLVAAAAAKGTGTLLVMSKWEHFVESLN